jgi:acyl-CoA thioesterase-2
MCIRANLMAPMARPRDNGFMDASQPWQTAQLQQLLQQLQLEQLDRDLFLGDPGKGEGRLFGGLVLAQSVAAAYRTVEGRPIHSLHAYFLRPGRHDVPVRYVVYRIRDGKSFTTRDVVAYQSGEAIFNLSASFTNPEPGYDHQEPMPAVPPPDNLPEWAFFRPGKDELPEEMQRWVRERPIEVRAIETPDPKPGETPTRRVWMRPKGELPEDPLVHAAVLAYSSDMGLLSTARPTMQRWRHRGMAASLDHAIWFHRPPRFDGWILYTSESPVAHAARALIFGHMYRPDGTLIATVAQEGLVRPPRDGSDGEG